MTEELDGLLRAALKPVEPGEAFTHRVMLRVAAQERAPLGRRAGGAGAWRWLSAAAAVGTVLALLLLHAREVQHTREGLKARQALIQALRVTGQSLDLASRALKDGG